MCPPTRNIPTNPSPITTNSVNQQICVAASRNSAFAHVPKTKFLKLSVFAIAAALLASLVCSAGVSAIVIIYQPIITAGEAVTIDTPKGFAVMPIPFECFHFHGRPPFYAIAQPNPLLTDAPRSRLPGDSNLVSLAGVTIGSSIDDDIVHVHFESLKPPAGHDATPDDIAEATLECIRRMAEHAPKRPMLKITGKKDEETKWLRWQDHFQKHDLTKPYLRPSA